MTSWWLEKGILLVCWVNSWALWTNRIGLCIFITTERAKHDLVSKFSTLFDNCQSISGFIIHQTFSLEHNWSKHAPAKLGIIRVIFPTAHVAKNIWRIINKIASIWQENMFAYSSLDRPVNSLKLKVFLELHSWKTVHFSEQISQHIFAPNEDRLCNLN